MHAAGAFFLQICVGKAEMSILISRSFWGKNIQGTSPFKVVFQGFSRHLQIQGRFKAFQGFKVVVATLTYVTSNHNNKKLRVLPKL